ncbi:hypothetical protein CM240_3058 [Clostridium bornimense]|uniref:FeS cluster biogenesis domain-containing protein n=1 Tax=Clostridium bornimense TaxID=1216932 RepID=W6SK45_9CLOT|nr:hypothetical protein [Clostridium bornimense]CDM70175.1 hypothetical protein CM240_3058 [Clostridium bornimense]
MNIVFDEKVKKALLELLKDTSADYIRIKPFRGCGKPAYQISISFKGKKDDEEKINEINFVFSKEDRDIIDNIEIKYDKDIYNDGFYIRKIL